jgi:general secretion pathway protein G
VRRQLGFTLIELVVTVAIIGLLATAVIPSAQLIYQRERESELRSALREIRTGIDGYKRAVENGHVKIALDQSGYPPSLQALVDGVEDARSAKEGVRIYFLRRIPRDPFWPDPTASAEDTWGLRSYASSADDPQPGDDVFDVYSRSAKTGLNGIPYREW